MKRIILALAATLAACLSVKAEEARLLRFPATNGSEIVFSYAGDLYSVGISGGQAKRLTSHKGYEMFAHYSPDGKTIAFTAEYDGNREVYLMPAQGGEPVRLTYTSTNERDELGDRMGPNNIVMSWTPDGKNIIYRNRISEGFSGKLWSVSPQGGMPQVLPLPEGGWCSYSPDGKLMAYNRVMREFRTWKYYRGGMADDVWVYDPKAKKVENITSNDAQDIFPMWIGDEIFFASDRDMTMNLFAYNTKTKKTEKVTNFKEYDVKFPSTDGKSIVFENGGYIYRFDPSTRKSEQVHITIDSDNIYARSFSRLLPAGGASLNPEGTRAAVTTRGEVFDVPVGTGVTRNISRTPGSNDRGAVWSTDGKSIAWIGDGTGECEIYIYDVEKGTQARQLTSGSDTYITSLQWSPDAKHILYSDRKNRLVEVDAATGAKKTLMTNPSGGWWGVEYSPDSKWLTYTRSGDNEMGIVYLYNLEQKKEYAVTEKWYNSSSPKFSSDGKYLIFNCDRTINPIYSRVEWDYAVADMSGMYMAILSKDTPSPLLPKDGTSVEKDRSKGDKPSEAVSVNFDEKDIFARIIKLPVNGRGIYCDGKKLWYSNGRGTSVYDFASGKDEKCADGMISYRPGDKKAIVRGGKAKVATFGAHINGGEEIDMKNMRATIDYSQEWPQLFHEVWRAFRDGYYLENMHGIDWKAIEDKYSVLIPHAKTRLDVNYIIGEMIGEVASGHAYVNVGEYDKPERISMGLLGAEFSKDRKSGYFKIEKILSGAPYSEKLRAPLAEPGLGVETGNFITAIDGVSLKDVDNIYKLLVGKANVLTEITVNTTAAEGGRKVIVKPIADEDPLYHYEWVIGNIKTVEEKSGGKVGYIYIPDMSQEGLSEFIRYYYPQLDKEALIIDDRANGGGNVSPMIIERLQREAYRLTMSRGSDRIGTVPEATHNGPKVLLINKYSASDGDLFPWSFKANKLGTVIGTRTWGGIVGISGSLRYMDGTDVRVPFFTNYDAKTGEWIVENHGVDPDILIDNNPVKENAGIDEQLLKAIEVALEQIKDRKDYPGVPAPRTFKDLGLPEQW